MWPGGVRRARDGPHTVGLKPSSAPRSQPRIPDVSRQIDAVDDQKIVTSSCTSVSVPRDPGARTPMPLTLERYLAENPQLAEPPPVSRSSRRRHSSSSSHSAIAEALTNMSMQMAERERVLVEHMERKFEQKMEEMKKQMRIEQWTKSQEKLKEAPRVPRASRQSEVGTPAAAGRRARPRKLMYLAAKDETPSSDSEYGGIVKKHLEALYKERKCGEPKKPTARDGVKLGSSSPETSPTMVPKTMTVN